MPKFNFHTKHMTDTRKFFVISAALNFGLGLLFLVYFNYLEYQARQELSPEMRTPEAIQSIYDGSVCLGCDISATILLILFSVIGTFIAVSWGIYETFFTKQQTLK